jgi:hypothetical protein
MRAHTHRRPRMLALIGAVMLVGAALALAACGGSSSAGTKNAAATTTTAGSSSGKDRRTAFRECLEKQGIKLPSAPTGDAQPGAGGPPAGGGGFIPPTGATSSKTQEAFKKCGGGNFRGGRFRNGAAFKARLTKFAACMRENGVKLPAPNTSGKGPVFDTKGVDTTSAAFKSAEGKCRSALKGAFPGGGRPPSGQQGPPEGAPAGEAPGA